MRHAGKAEAVIAIGVDLRRDGQMRRKSASARRHDL
jgi:hypothetical protein